MFKAGLFFERNNQPQSFSKAKNKARNHSAKLNNQQVYLLREQDALHKTCFGIDSGYGQQK